MCQKYQTKPKTSNSSISLYYSYTGWRNLVENVILFRYVNILLGWSGFGWELKKCPTF